MIILPSTPPLPTAAKTSVSIDPQLVSGRSSLVVSSLGNYNESIRYAVDLEHYLETILQFGYDQSRSDETNRMVQFLSTVVYISSGEIPWKGIGEVKRLRKLNKAFKSTKEAQDIRWTLYNELETVLVSLALIYVKIGSELTNELIDIESAQVTPEINEKWKQANNFYKKSISFGLFGLHVSSAVGGVQATLSPTLFTFINGISEICIQMSILSKSSWINRSSLDTSQAAVTKNNGTLSRVAIYVVDKLKTAKQLLHEIEISTDYIPIDTSNWDEYLGVIEKYSLAYAALFLSIENYLQDKLGHAIGLINFGLLNLQSKNIDAANETTKKFLSRFKGKLAIKKNDQLLTSLNSVSSMNINKSIFNDKSGIVLNDLSYLFDQLIRLHLKFTKENDNLKFDTVVDWKDVNNDSKWPLGSKIPVSKVEPYSPIGRKDESKSEYSGRGAYY